MKRGYREDPNLTPRQRRDNWWRYHWLQMLCAVLAVTALSGVLWERAHREVYDCSVALVTRYAAAAEEIDSLRSALEAV